MVVCARPDALDAAAERCNGLDDTLEAAKNKLSAKLAGFQSINRWGTLDARALVQTVSTWIAANRTDSRYLRTVAAAFREADARGAALCYATNGQIAAALAAKGLDGPRADLDVPLSKATGGQTSTGFMADPVNAASGNFLEVEVDLGFGPTLSWLQVRRTYNSLDTVVGPFGPGWSSWASARLGASASGRVAHLQGPDGQRAHVPVTPTTSGDGSSARLIAAMEAAAGFEGEVEPDEAGGLVARFPREGLVWRFDPSSRPVEIDHGAGTRVTLRWVGERLVGLSHERGRSLDFEWGDDLERIVAAVADDGRRVTYGYDDEGRLVTVDGPLGRRCYQWDEASRLTAVVDADGVVQARNTYDHQGRVVRQETAFGRRVRFRYRPGLVTEVDDDQGGPTNTWVHDELGRVTRVVDGDGNATTIAYDDGTGRPSLVTDRRGGTTELSWDDHGRQSRITRPDGVSASLEWDDRHRCVAVTGPNGASVRYTYRGDERVPSTITDPEGGVTRLELVDGLVAKVVDADGVTTTLDHDEQGRVVALTDGAGATRRCEWDPTGQLTAVVSPLGRRTVFELDAAGRVIARRDPDGAVWRVERSPAGRVTATVDPTGARHELRYGAHGHVVEEVDPTGATTTLRWDDQGSLVSTVLPDGAAWTFTHDALLRVAGVTDPAGATWRREHDPEGTLVGTVTPTGVRRKVDVDPTGAITRVDDGKVAVRFEHDEAGRAVAQVRPDGTAVRGRYDRCGRLVELTGSGDGVTRFEHSPAGRLTAAVGPTGSRVTYRYDAAGRLREVVDPLGGRQRLRYDAGGQLVRVTGPAGEVTRYRYDAAGRVVAVTSPNGGVTRYDHDPVGRLASVTAPDGGTTRYRYDAAGRVVAVVDPNGGELRCERDAAGRVTATVDPLGARTAIRYDLVGRPVEVVDPLGRTTRHTYDPSGRPIGRTDPDGARWWWRWDGADRLSAWGVGDAASTATTLRRDLLGRVVRIERDGEAVTREWDADGNLAAEATAQARMRWSRDAAGHVVGATIETAQLGEATTTYELDACGRPALVDDPALGRLSIERDPAGRPTRLTGPGLVEERTWSHGLLASWSRELDGRVAASVGYRRDPSGRIVEERHGDGRRIRYGYDPAGQLCAIDGPEGSWRFDWDGAGRLVHEDAPGGPRRFGYDAAGQLTTIHGPGGATRLDWDPCGRRLAETGPGLQRRYTWDAFGDLAAVQSTRTGGPNGGGPNGGEPNGGEPNGGGPDSDGRRPDGSGRVRRFSHDPLGRLATVDGTALAWDPTSWVEPLWAIGDRRVAGGAPTPLALAAAVPGDSPAGGGGAGPHAATGPAGDSVGADGGGRAGGGPVDGSGARGTAGWLPTDARGEPGGLDPWGTGLPKTTPLDDVDGATGTATGAPDLPGGLTLGHRGELAIDGLVWLRARAYDPATRSFLTPDPLPGPAGAPWGSNPYHYGANDPVGHADPLGLRAVSDVDLAELRDNWNKNAWERYGGYIAAAGMIGAGVGLQFVPGVGTVLGGALIGAAVSGAISAASQQALSGRVNWGQVGVDTAIGVAGGGAGAATSVATAGSRAIARYGARAATDIHINVVGGAGSRFLMGQNPLDPTAVGLDVLTGGTGSAAGTGIDDALRHARIRGTVLVPGPPTSVEQLMQAEPRQGLPGARGAPIPNRPTPQELNDLSERHGVEFGVSYKHGPRRNGGGGRYFMFSGGPRNVSMAFQPDMMHIYHTHPADPSGLVKPSAVDHAAIAHLREIGSPQRTSYIVSPDAPNPVPFTERPP